MTRRTPNRKAQWQQIGILRKHGSLGRPTRSPATAHRATIPPQLSDRSFDRHSDTQFEELEYLIPEDEAGQLSEVKPEIGPAVAALTASLFLLACAFAAFSGWMHSTDDRYAYFGILGAVASLLAAGIGICLAGSGVRCSYSCRFLSVCALSLAGLYGGLLLFACR